MLSRLLIAVALLQYICLADDPAAQIMQRVAANQDRAVELRRSFVFQQHIVVATRHFNGKLAREEKADYDVVPSGNTIGKKLVSLSGLYVDKSHVIKFSTDSSTAETRPQAGSLDGGLVKDFRDDLLNDKSKDGVAKDLFPLTTEEQKNYRFQLQGHKQVEGRDTYILAFAPSDKNDIGWAGEAWIDAEELQPVRVFTQLSRKFPFLVRSMLGTDLPGIGFNVQYKRVEKDVWFPVSFGSEFRLKAVFFIKRDISMSMEATNFRKVQIDTNLQYENP
jgi:hypothetical protein